MAYREFSVTEIREVLRNWLKGKGFRAVAQLCNVDRKTARRYIEVAQELGVERPLAPGGRVVLSDELIGQIAQAVLPGRATHSGAMRQHCEKHRGYRNSKRPTARFEPIGLRFSSRLSALPRRSAPACAGSCDDD